MSSVRPLQDSNIQADEPRNVLDSIKVGYLANNSPSAMDDVGSSEPWRAASEKDALNGEWVADDPVLTPTAHLAFDEDALVLQRDADEESIERFLRSPGPFITPFGNAINGDDVLDDDGFTTTAIVNSAANVRFNARDHPFNLSGDSAGLDPASAFEFVIARKLSGVEDQIEPVVHDGREMWAFGRQVDQDCLDVRTIIDPNRSDLPVLTEMDAKPDHSLYSRMRLLETHEERGAFFPTHFIKCVVRQSENGEASIEVREMKVLELDLSCEPTETDLDLTLPRRTQFSEGVNPSTAKALFRESAADAVQVAASDLGGLDHPLQDIAQDREWKQSLNESGAIGPQQA